MKVVRRQLLIRWARTREAREDSCCGIVEVCKLPVFRGLRTRVCGPDDGLLDTCVAGHAGEAQEAFEGVRSCSSGTGGGLQRGDRERGVNRENRRE